jgi:hypothetical protein
VTTVPSVILEQDTGSGSAFPLAQLSLPVAEVPSNVPSPIGARSVPSAQDTHCPVSRITAGIRILDLTEAPYFVELCDD